MIETIEARKPGEKPECLTCGHRTCPSWCGGDAVGRWVTSGACGNVDPEVFFPETGSGTPMVELTREAKRICNSCPVRVECLEYALEERLDHGVWGGLTATDRRYRENELLAAIKKRRENEKRLAAIR